jgi:hypothetical protein
MSHEFDTQAPGEIPCGQIRMAKAFREIHFLSSSSSFCFFFLHFGVNQLHGL